MGAAFDQVWPAFVLVAGLLLVGQVAASEHVLAVAGSRLERVPGPAWVMLAAGMSLEFAVTAVLNLDTAVVFLTPVLVLAARRRGTSELPFLYAAVLMANASSLALPGANLTNLIALSGDHLSGSAYVLRYGPMAVGVALATATGLLVIHRRTLRRPAARPPVQDVPRPGALGLTAIGLGGAAVIALPNPALPVLAVGVLALALSVVRGTTSAAAALRVVDLRVLGGLFVVAVLLGTVARHLHNPAGLDSASALRTALTATVAAVLLNNLPAAAVLAAHPVAHPGALLLGLGVGPNLAVTGSLSAYLWWQAARAVDARPSLVTLTRHGLVLVPGALAAGLLLL